MSAILSDTDFILLHFSLKNSLLFNISFMSAILLVRFLFYFVL